MHLTELEIAAFIDKKLNSRQIEKVLEHLSKCQKCYDEFAEIYELVHIDAQNNLTKNIADYDYTDKTKNFVKYKKQLKYHNSKGKFFGTKKIAFAFIVAAFAISILLIQTKFENINVQYRSENHKLTLRLFAPIDLSIINSNQLNFSWSSFHGTRSYILKIYDTNGNTVLKKTTKNIYFKLPNKTNLFPGKKYLWQVFAFLNDGEKIGSKLYAFSYER